MRYSLRFPIVATCAVLPASAVFLFAPSLLLHTTTAYARVFSFVLARPFSPVLQRSKALAASLFRNAVPTDLQIVLVGLSLTILIWIALSVLLGAIYDFARSRISDPSKRQDWRPYALFLTGLPANVGCYLLHVCMHGHMQHPPYSAYHYALDSLWTLAFLAAAILGFSERILCFRAWFWSLVLLTFCRIVVGSYGGLSSSLEALDLLFLIGLTVIWFATFRRNWSNNREVKVA